MTLLVRGLDVAESTTLERLLTGLEARSRRNMLLDAYYGAHNEFVTAAGGSIPPGYEVMASVLDWPAKGVDKLDERCNLEGFTIPGADSANDDLDRIWLDNHLNSSVQQAISSALVHGVSFLVVVKGEAGEPAAVVIPKSAREATGEWNARAWRMSSFLSVTSFNATTNDVEAVNLYLPGVTLTLTRRAGRWELDNRQQTGVDRVLAHPLVFKPRLGRPFGRSRISRPVLNFTDAAMRALLRAEVNAELYSTPQRILLGADDTIFKNPDGSMKSQWQMMMGRWLGVPADAATDNIPQVQQLAQASQQPHMDQIAMLAKLCAGAMSLPVTEMGISTDANPASAEALRAHQDSLISIAERADEDFTPGLRGVALDALMVANDSTEQPDEWRALLPVWRSPEHTSLTSQADAFVKLAGVAPWLAESETWIDMLPTDATTKARLKDDMRRSGATAALRASLTSGTA